MRLSAAIARLDGLRGRARVRALGTNDLLQACSEAARDRAHPWGVRAGMTVANAYGYPAYRMRLAAVRLVSGDYAVRADWGNAKRGSSECPIGGRRDGSSGWAVCLDRISRRRTAPRGWWQVSGNDVRRARAERRLAARRVAASRFPEPPEGLRVTVADSLAAGNCERETARVAAWFGDTADVDARALRREILAREPELTAYAVAAIVVAKGRRS